MNNRNTPRRLQAPSHVPQQLKQPPLAARSSVCIEVTGYSRGVDRAKLRRHMTALVQKVNSQSSYLEFSGYDEERNATYYTVKKRDGKNLISTYLEEFGERLTFDEQNLKMRPVDMELYNDNPSVQKHPTHALIITGIGTNVSEWKLKNTLCDHKEAIGGRCNVYFDRHDHSAVVSFDEPTVTGQVLQYYANRPLEIEGRQVKLQKLLNTFRPSATLFDVDNCLFVRGFSDDVEADDIRKFLSSASAKVKVKYEAVLFGTHPGTVLVYHNKIHNPDYADIYKTVCTKPLLGKMIEVELVPRSRVLEVHTSKDIKPIDVCRYLKDKHDCRDMKTFPRNEKGIILVRMNSPEEAEKVASSKRITAIHQEKVTIKIHHECLGCLPPGHNTEGPAFSLPGEATFQLSEPTRNFIYQKRQNYMSTLNTKLKDLHGKVDNITEKGIIYIKCLITKDTDQFRRKSKSWNSEISQQLKLFEDSFTFKQVSVPEKSAKSEKIGEKIPKSFEQCDIKVDWEKCIVNITGEVASVGEVFESMSKIIDRLERMTKMEFEFPSNNHMELLLKMKERDMLENEFEDMKISFEKENLSLLISGVDTEVQIGHKRIEEKVTTMGEIILPLSGLLQHLHKEMRSRLQSLFDSKTCVHEITENKINIICETKQKAEELLSNCQGKICEKAINIPAKCMRVVKKSNDLWRRFYDDMKKQKTFDIFIELENSQICFAAIGDKADLDKISKRIHQFLLNNKETAFFYGIPQEITKYIGKWLIADLREQVDSYVDVETCTDGSGLIICGAPTEVENAKAKVENVCKSVDMKTVKISEKYGMPKFFMSDDGQNFLDKLQTEQKVLIQLETTGANSSYGNNKDYKWILVEDNKDNDASPNPRSVNSDIEIARAKSSRQRKPVDKMDVTIGKMMVHVFVSEIAVKDQEECLQNNQLNWKKHIRKRLEEAISGLNNSSIPFPSKENGKSSLPAIEMAKIFAACLADVVTTDKIVSTTEISIVTSSSEDKAQLSTLLRSLTEKHSITFHIFGQHSSIIEQVKEEIFEKCTQQSQITTLPIHEYKEFIERLHDKQRAEIMKLQDSLPVKITISSAAISIEGLSVDISSVKMVIDTMLHQYIESERDKTQLQWFYIDSENKMCRFNPDTEHNLETGFQEYAKTKQRFKVTTDNAEVDYSNMTIQYDSQCFSIKRQPYTEVKNELPKAWTGVIGDNQNHCTVAVIQGSEEFQKVVEKLLLTLGTTLKNIEVARIEHPMLHQRFEVRKRALEKQNRDQLKPGEDNERLLWHGTSVDTIESINSNSFNRAYCGKNATAFGQGVYFAVNASYSNDPTYARPDDKGYKYMYLVRVLTGVYTKGSHAMKVPPTRINSIQYDSVVNDEQNPSMFVCFYDECAYPQYLLKYK